MTVPPPIAPACPSCRQPLPADPATLGTLGACPACTRPVRVTLLPGYHRPAPTGAAPRPAVAPGEARCFFHADRHAEHPCDRCGRYLCALCDVPVGGRHLCPQCLAVDEERPGGGPEPARVRWDRVAWWTLIAGFLLCWPSLLVLGPLVIVLAVVRSQAPPSRVAASRANLVAAAVAGGVLFLVSAGLAMLVAGRLEF